MKRLPAVIALGMLLAALMAPPGAASGGASFGLTGEARALEVAIGNDGVTLGLALSKVESAPRALGVGAGQCTLIGDQPDPNDLPCSEESTSLSRYPGAPGSDDLTCAQSLPPPLGDLIDLKLACGASKSGLKGDLPMTRNTGRIGNLGVRLPVGQLVNLPVPQLEELVDDLTGALAPVLGVVPKEVHQAVDEVVELLQEVTETQLVQANVGNSTSNIVPNGDSLTVTSDSGGARIGLIGVPSVTDAGNVLAATASPLENGLVIVEVGTAQATASINTKTAAGSADASPALVTVKVRDITKDEPTYVTVTVAPGQTVTVLQGTPAESTITAADSTTDVSGGSARAAADAVRLHLLKGVQGGVKVGLARATAAASVEAAPRVLGGPEPKVLPVTGGTGRSGPAVVLILIAAALFLTRRLVHR